ncbi:hypothetical protein MKX01_032010 [Papaver californicum]|nr:hypothetical protein MKX01_032010 [Papaver californicum]
MDQKKRTLDALERRFALAKAEVLQQQQPSPPPKIRKLSHIQQANEEGIKNTNSSSKISCYKETFCIRTPGASDSEGDGLTYSQICQPVHDNLLKSDVEPTSRGSTVDKILHKLLQSGDSAQKYMQGSRSMKIDNWILLDKLVQGHGATVGARIKDYESHSKRSRKHMSMKQHKKCGSFDLPKKFHNSVADCKVNSYTGVSGIMIRETAETFGIITQDNKFRVVPKKPSVFILQTDCWRITLHGDKFTFRNCHIV